MPATLEIEKETAEMLAAQAEARGMSVDDYLRSLLKDKAISEDDLLRRIKNGFPQSQRLRELTSKSEAETLSDEERAEYITLAQQREVTDTERMRAVVELAQLRGVSPDQLLTEPGLGADA